MSANSEPSHKSLYSVRYRLWHIVEHHLPTISVYLMVAVFGVTVLYPYMVKDVPSGQVGVLWKRFGGGTVLAPGELREEGLHLILPWDHLFIYNLRLQSFTETYNAISSDGVSLSATINVRFRLSHDQVPLMHQAVGPKYLKMLVLPEIGSRAREIIARYTAEDIYSRKRRDIEKEIRTLSETTMGVEATSQVDSGTPLQNSMSLVKLYDTLMLSIKLPKSVMAAIDGKIEQYYKVQEYGFRVDREQKEYARKVIEAKGIAEFQKIVSEGISDSYLRWRGIEATLELARSNNSKVVVIGSGKDGLPIILGNVDSPPAPKPELAASSKAVDKDETKGATQQGAGKPAVAPPPAPKPQGQLSTPSSSPSMSDSLLSLFGRATSTGTATTTGRH